MPELRRRFVSIASATAVAGASAAMLVACSSKPSSEFVGKEIQVTNVFDDPALPTSTPDNTVPPMISLGGRSYTIDSPCGTARGDIQWRGSAAVMSAPETTSTFACNANAQTFSDRFLRQVEGEFSYAIANNTVRFARIGDTQPGQSATGWSGLWRDK